ncbi:MAG: hypothetical protein J6T96_09975, partial [Bacteroidales bacterium]|nr:hypothetical protein [Bacteroidales bacterium]
MANKLCMMLIIILFAMPLGVYSQTDTLPINIRELLDKSSIVYDTTTNDKLVISVGRGSKSVDELPVTVYIISHDDIV